MGPWTIACQAPLSIGFSRQEYWSGFPFLSPGNLPNPMIKSRSPDIFTGHDCASKILRESNPGFPWHVGKCPLPHSMSYLVTWPQKRLAYAPISLEILGKKRWTFRFCQRSGSIKGSYGRVGTDIILTFLSFLYQRPMSFCLGSVR